MVGKQLIKNSVTYILDLYNCLDFKFSGPEMLNWQKQCYMDSLGPLLFQASMSCFLIVELTLLCEFENHCLHISVSHDGYHGYNQS